MNILVCISSKSPNPFLYDSIISIHKNQMIDNNNYKICVIDSDSDDFETYNKIKHDFPDVDLLFVKNKHYEYGAWDYAHKTYPDYDVYFCMQDSITVERYIDVSNVDDNNSYCFHHHTGYYFDLEVKQIGIDNLKDSGLNYLPIIDTYFNLAQHSTFIVNNKTIKDIYNTLKNPPTDKRGSRMYERNFGIYFILKNINTINLNDYMSKMNGKRI